jgi:beta-phosphoglucomutase-like phosphatase (HAD superfamily)
MTRKLEPMTRRQTLVVFDIDGTLIDSNNAHATAWMRALREYGRRVDITQVRPLLPPAILLEEILKNLKQIPKEKQAASM